MYKSISILLFLLGPNLSGSCRAAGAVRAERRGQRLHLQGLWFILDVQRDPARCHLSHLDTDTA